MSAKTSTTRVKCKQSGITWVAINRPNQDVVKKLHRKYKFHHLDLEDCLSDIQRPKIDDYEEYLFIVFHLPVRRTRKKPINTSEIDVFIGQDFVITLTKDNIVLNKLLEKLQNNKKLREEYMSKGSGYFLYKMIDDLFDQGFPLLDTIANQISELEVEVFESDYSKDRLREILLLKKDIINFRRIVMPQRTIIAQLEHKNKKFLPENLDVYFDDIVDKIEKMWNNLENLQELVLSLQETNESIISHNTNNVIKVLTLFSVVMLPMTFITGFYGMNVQGLPYANHVQSTPIIASIILSVALIMILYFRYKRWL